MALLSTSRKVLTWSFFEPWCGTMGMKGNIPVLPHETRGEDGKPSMIDLVELGEVRPASPTNPFTRGVVQICLSCCDNMQFYLDSQHNHTVCFGCGVPFGRGRF